MDGVWCLLTTSRGGVIGMPFLVDISLQKTLYQLLQKIQEIKSQPLEKVDISTLNIWTYQQRISLRGKCGEQLEAEISKAFSSDQLAALYPMDLLAEVYTDASILLVQVPHMYAAGR
jgi:hypothetical protein